VNQGPEKGGTPTSAKEKREKQREKKTSGRQSLRCIFCEYFTTECAKRRKKVGNELERISRILDQQNDKGKIRKKAE